MIPPYLNCLVTVPEKVTIKNFNFDIVNKVK